MGNSHIDKRAKYTQIEIEAAFFRLLEIHPLPSISVTMLCKEADINRGTFYRYYLDIKDLCDKLTQKVYDELQPALSKYSASGNSEICRRLLTYIQAHKDFLQLLSQNQANAQLIPRLVSVTQDSVLRVWKEIKPSLTDVQMDYYYEYMTEGCVGIILKWVNHNMTESIDEICEIIDHLCTTVTQNL